MLSSPLLDLDKTSPHPVTVAQSLRELAAELDRHVS
jgi:hypothetical protein